MIQVDRGHHAYVLEHLDKSNGTRIKPIFDAARSLAPLVRQTTLLLPTSDEDPYQEPGTLFFPNSLDVAVILPPNLAFYEVFRTGYLTGRFKNMRAMLERPDYGHTLPQLQELAFAHELGHAARLLDLLDEEDDGAVIERLEAEKRAEYKTLPLGTNSSNAKVMWDTNQGGYRTTLEKKGYDEAEFAYMLDVNLEVYGQLEVEIEADAFGAEAIALAYAA